jgi:isoquinoline 1-oxidoreductase subunit alpha
MFLEWRGKEVCMISLTVNGKTYEVDAAPDTPLLWVLREKLKLTGTKYGCGSGLCGACTVLAGGEPVRSCMLPVKDAAGMKITTIEAIDATRQGRALQSAWLEVDVPQCGYCQSGQIMAAAALLAKNARPNDDDINAAMQGIVCRCGTYQRIRRAIHRAAALMARGGAK